MAGIRHMLHFVTIFTTRQDVISHLLKCSALVSGSHTYVNIYTVISVMVSTCHAVICICNLPSAVSVVHIPAYCTCRPALA